MIGWEMDRQEFVWWNGQQKAVRSVASVTRLMRFCLLSMSRFEGNGNLGEIRKVRWWVVAGGRGDAIAKAVVCPFTVPVQVPVPGDRLTAGD